MIKIDTKSILNLLHRAIQEEMLNSADYGGIIKKLDEITHDCGDEQLKIIEEIELLHGELEDIAACEYFEVGFKAGFKLALETFDIV